MSEALPSEESLRDALAACGADLRPGLSDAEFDRVESEFDFRFAPDHRRLLSVALPVGDAWPDWRGGDRLELRERLDWPVRGILFDVQRNRFWHPEWEARPAETAEALSVARERLSEAPPLALLYGHRYLPTKPHTSGNPVLSVYQTDIIYYGNDLLDWLEYEFQRTSSALGKPREVPVWSWYVENA